MSKEENMDKGLHIVLGISENNDSLIKALKEEFSKQNIEIMICVSKYQKSSIEAYLSEHDDVDVLIVSEYLQSAKPYDIADYERLNDILPKLMIIPVLSKSKRGTPYINKILALGIYTALFENHASVSAIVEMIVSGGRTRKEARHYYEVETVSEIGKTADINACVDHISFSGEREETKERADYVRAALSEKEFGVVISRLPRDIKDRLKVFEDYAVFFEDELSRDKENDKRVLFPNKILKSLIPSQDEDAALSSVIKQEVQSAVKKVVIGFAGTQQRIGTTHQAIWFGNYLKKAGYKIALLENEHNINKSFHTIMSAYSAEMQDGYFTYEDIDYYPDFNLSNLSKIFLKDYNFVLIDFGMFSDYMSPEFGRCVAQIIVCGAKPWETPMLEKLMSEVNNEEVLKKYHYLFMFTPDSERKSITRNMDVLKNIYFADYQADPFDCEGCDSIREILSDYLPDEKYVRKGRFFERMQRLFE